MEKLIIKVKKAGTHGWWIAIFSDNKINFEHKKLRTCTWDEKKKGKIIYYKETEFLTQEKILPTLIELREYFDNLKS